MLKLQINTKNKINSTKLMEYNDSGVDNNFIYFYTNKPHGLVDGEIIRLENVISGKTFNQDVKVYIPESGVNILGTYNTYGELASQVLNPVMNDTYFINDTESYYRWNGSLWGLLDENDLFVFKQALNLVKTPILYEIDLNFKSASSVKIGNPNNNTTSDAILFTFNKPIFLSSTHEDYKIVRNIDTYSSDIDKGGLKIGDYVTYGGAYLYVAQTTTTPGTFNGPLNPNVDIHIKTSTMEFDLHNCIVPILNDGTDDLYHVVWQVTNTVLLDDGRSVSGNIIKNQFLNYGDYVNITQKDERFLHETFNDALSVLPSIQIFRYSDYYEVEIPIACENSLNLFQGDIVENDFVKIETEKAINSIVNMERQVFVPSYIKQNFDENKIYCSKPSTNQEVLLNDIDTIELNFHFRDRFVHDATVPFNPPYLFNDNWLADEGTFWNGYKLNSAGTALEPRDSSITFSDNQSDLLGYLNFNIADVNYQKSKLKKSFVRLSFFDSKDIQTQKLLYYSTVFVDTGELFGRYAKNTETSGYTSIIDPVSFRNIKGIDVINEYKVLDEDRRLSTRITINSKYNQYKSSEGFYIYLFAENAPKIRPQSIYMKVEYNHAGYGRTIPMIMPVGDNYTPIGIRNANFPFNGFAKVINNEQTLDMKSYYDALFIELKLVYDETFNGGVGRYVYFLPNAINNDDRKMVFNLYEAKIQ